MRKKMIWGIVTLIVLLIIGVSVFMLMRNTDTEPNIPIVKHVEPSEDNPPADEPGFVWEWHHNHWHKVPISEANGDTAEANGDDPVSDIDWSKRDPRLDERGFLKKNSSRDRPPPGPRTDLKPQSYFGPLTYHAELLETHPVKALILQTKERGHWSADWILPLPPEDAEAQAYAKTEYLIHYYESIKDTDNPIYKKAREDNRKMSFAISESPYGGRHMDLARLAWPSLDDGTSSAVYGWPSEYLGIPKHSKD